MNSMPAHPILQRVHVTSKPLGLQSGGTAADGTSKFFPFAFIVLLSFVIVFECI